MTANEVFNLQVNVVLRKMNESESGTCKDVLQALHLQNDELFKHKLIKIDEYQNNRARINAWARIYWNN
jgi:hypothetical protein